MSSSLSSIRHSELTSCLQSHIRKRWITSLSTRIPLTSSSQTLFGRNSSTTCLSILRLWASYPGMFKYHLASTRPITRIHCYQDHSPPCSLRLPLSLMPVNPIEQSFIVVNKYLNCSSSPA
ncbi:hypothetical protein ATANTOWER_025188 [Ataeniobius toweri]|uniref:Uncharacterized protein n=1 Tax=Ataeniobius toweri TaxID=208326 RepID=A0ABU7AU04_9TELE|nr:hypothetical protein [Ataeniobius toweri]